MWGEEKANSNKKNNREQKIMSINIWYICSILLIRKIQTKAMWYGVLFRKWARFQKSDNIRIWFRPQRNNNFCILFLWKSIEQCLLKLKICISYSPAIVSWFIYSRKIIFLKWNITMYLSIFLKKLILYYGNKQDV